MDKFITKKKPGKSPKASGSPKSPKSSGSPKSSSARQEASDLGRRSTTMHAKNYRYVIFFTCLIKTRKCLVLYGLFFKYLNLNTFSELESDTESLFESKVPYRSPHIRALKLKPAPSKSKNKQK